MQALGSNIRQALLPLMEILHQESSRYWKKKHLPQKAGLCSIHTGFDLEENHIPPAEKYDLVYCKIWVADLLEQMPSLRKIKQGLAAEGKLILEVYQLKGFFAYPYHHAFSRVADLFSQVEQAYPNTPDFRQHCIDLLEQYSFQVLEINYAPPAFIAKCHKDILSLMLDLLKEKLLPLRLLGTEELKALMLELKQFENRPNTLISKPGLYQIVMK